MKIKFLKPHHRYSYFPGDVADFDEKEAIQLFAEGYAIADKTSAKPAKEKEPDPSDQKPAEK